MASLDALRSLAAVAVVVYHYTHAFDQSQYFPGYPPAWFSFGAGRYGVQMFFVISGFVILMTIGRVKGVGDFAYARFSRLYPPYWASLFFVSDVRISLPDNVEPAVAADCDAFLQQQVKRDDLLLRLGPVSWILVTPDKREAEVRFLTRALRDEFANLLLVGLPGASGLQPLPNGALLSMWSGR